MKKLCVPFLLLVVSAASGAFEACPESPWLYGHAAALFPRSALAVSMNPAAPGMLEGTGVAVGASRPFGISRLSRVAVAGNTFISGAGVGAMLSGTGSTEYSEFTLMGAGAFRLARSLVAGVSLSCRRLSIQGYGGAFALGTSAAVVGRPATGVYMGLGCRGLYSSHIGGLPAVPGAVFASAGLVPLENLLVSGAAVFHRYTGAEFGVHTSLSPSPGLVLGLGCLSGPARLSFSIGIEPGAASISYGYSTHPCLQGSHLGEVGWGRAAFSPAPLQGGSHAPELPPVAFPVNINTATERELTAIPGIGPARASAILAWLAGNGPVESLDQLLEVPGIGPSTLETLESYLTVE